MLELMTWNEIVDSIISDGKLKKAAIFDLKGEKLAGTSGIKISRAEAIGVIQCLPQHSATIFSFYIEGAKYNLFAVDDSTLLGRNASDIFVAHLSRNVLICGFTDIKSDVSCLGGVREFATKLVDQVSPGSAAAPSLM